jgi:hypothetical protein
MGLLTGTILYPSITETRTRKFTLWGIRVVALVLAIVAFSLSTHNFCTFFDIRLGQADFSDTDDPVCCLLISVCVSS